MTEPIQATPIHLVEITASGGKWARFATECQSPEEFVLWAVRTRFDCAFGPMKSVRLLKMGPDGWVEIASGPGSET